jgi:hypothetical protein
MREVIFVMHNQTLGGISFSVWRIKISHHLDNANINYHTPYSYVFVL